MYSIKVSLNAQEELQEIEANYFLISEKVANKFILNLSKSYQILTTNPHFSIKHKNYRTISIDKFPYVLFFEISEIVKEVYVLSCFHTSQNPNKYPI